MPKHPFIKKPIYEVFPTMRYDMRFGQFHDGPVAGKQRQFDGTFIVEVSDRTFKGMLDHKVRCFGLDHSNGGVHIHIASP